jgi:hypothetical protein
MEFSHSVLLHCWEETPPTALPGHTSAELLKNSSAKLIVSSPET